MLSNLYLLLLRRRTRSSLGYRTARVNKIEEKYYANEKQFVDETENHIWKNYSCTCCVWRIKIVGCVSSSVIASQTLNNKLSVVSVHTIRVNMSRITDSELAKKKPETNKKNNQTLNHKSWRCNVWFLCCWCNSLCSALLKKK